MVTLALDTSTAHGGVAIARAATLLATVEGDPRRTHGERLPSDVFRALTEAGLALDEVGRLAVVIGPGGFTGLRVGIATVQGFAMATGLRVVVMSALEAMARAGVGLAGPAMRPGHLMAVLMDAKRGECFGQAWRVKVKEDDGHLDLVALVEPAVDRAETLLRQWTALAVEGVWWCVADEAERADQGVRLSGPERVMAAPPSLAPVLALRAGVVSDADTVRPHAIQPIYVRRPDAVLARERRAASSGDVA